MSTWSALLDVLVVLGAAMVLGMVADKLRQSPILGYLAAGVLLGPGVLGVFPAGEGLLTLSEIGVALLLFTLGLEFSWRRLKRFGIVALGGGSLQILLTILVVTTILVIAGAALPLAVTVGAMLALSSTATVLRVLIDRTEVDAVHGRTAVGILLLQDVALVPLVLLVTALGGETLGDSLLTTGRTLLWGTLLVAAFWVIANYLLPRLLGAAATARNRELAVLLAVVTAGGATWSAHAAGLSPALGAFIAGMLLAESPFSIQIRADIAGVRTLFLTLFFVAVGMQADIGWLLGHPVAFFGIVVGVVVGKALIVWGVLAVLGVPSRHGLATAICLSQVGEFAFVLAEIARGRGLLDPESLAAVVTVTLALLFATPYLVASAPRVSEWLALRLARPGAGLPQQAGEPVVARRDHVIVVGHGPAGAGAVSALTSAGFKTVVIDLNRDSLHQARRAGASVVYGDATQEDIMLHAHVASACAVVVALPDHQSAVQVIRLTHAVRPELPVVARARYHRFASFIAEAGAMVVVDEERQMAHRLGEEVLVLLGGHRTPGTLDEAANA